MAFTGTGIAHITGFTDTPASFALQGAGSGFDFTLSSSTTGSIPEGNTTVLLVLGLVLVGIVTFRQKLGA
jgi:BRCT domain type II-containing protein